MGERADEREVAIRAAADHVAALRARLVAGRAEIERQRSSVSETREHLSGMARWIEQTDQQLGEERARRAEREDDSS
jgi:predicted  nucleic acid-binding Zn-ribbon protein